MMGVLRSTLMAALALLVTACGAEESVLPSMEQAVEYQIIEKRDTTRTEGGETRTARAVYIYAPVTDVVSRVYTSLKAAVRVQEEDGVQFAEAFLLAGPYKALAGTGKFVAKARYALDGLDDSPLRLKLTEGIWDARYSEFVITELEAKITNLWFENRKRFSKPANYGLTQVDLPLMQAFIAKELKIDPKDVKMTQWQNYKYFPEDWEK
jgi:hypothetical protein